MAKQGMGKSMGNRECAWIRPRLPLWVGSGDEKDGSSVEGEGVDLSAKERRHIEQHLVTCSTCRDYRASLDQALGALAVAATQLPFVSQAPSLWPSLERRIANRQAARLSRWPKSARRLTERLVSPWGNLDGVRVLRRAWTRDTVHEVLGARKQPISESKRILGFVLKVSAAAAVVITLVEISVVRPRWKSAQSTILVNTMPLAEPVARAPVAVEPVPEISNRDHGDDRANQLAEAEPPRPAEASAPALDAAAAAPKSPPNTRFGFDLEHGTPMPPDSREAKPVY